MYKTFLTYHPSDHMNNQLPKYLYIQRQIEGCPSATPDINQHQLCIKSKGQSMTSILNAIAHSIPFLINTPNNQKQLNEEKN